MRPGRDRTRPAAGRRDAAVGPAAALITLNGAVAALLPLVVLLALRIGQPRRSC